MIIRVFVGFLVLFLIGVFLREPIAKFILVSAVQKTTGVSIEIQELHLALLKGIVKIKGLKLMNPKEFPEKYLAEIPELYFDVDPGSLLQGKIHLEKMILNLDQLTLLRNQQGELNLSSLKPVSGDSKGKQEKPPSEKSPKERAFQLDYLRLSIGKVYYRDYRVGNPPPSREYSIEIKGAEYRDIQDPGDLVRHIVSQALAKTALNELGGLEGIQRRLQRDLQKASSRTQKVLHEATEAFNALPFLKPKSDPSQEKK